jgi:hypothetical protein
MIGGASSGRRSTRGTCSRFSLTCTAVSDLSRCYGRDFYIVRTSCLLLQASRVCKRKGLRVRCCKTIRVLFFKVNCSRIHATRMSGPLLVFGFPMRAIGLILHSYRVASATENIRGTFCASAVIWSVLGARPLLGSPATVDSWNEEFRNYLETLAAYDRSQ